MTEPAPIPGPVEVLRRHGLHARKSWGQNFLRDFGVHRAIVEASGAGPDNPVIEIGAGLGTLTAHLLAAGGPVHAIERDRDLCQVLRVELGPAPNFTLHEADAVKVDYGTLIPGATARPGIVGNLPYHLTGPLLFRLLDHHAVTGTWVVMVQREVAQRLCAEPGSKRYGGITAAMGRVRAIRKVCDAPPHCFVPAPRVDSAVIRLDPRPEPLGEVGDPSGYLLLVRTAFQRRRKTLRNALRALAEPDRVERWLEATGIDPTLRPERLGPAEFAALQRAREAEDA